MVIGTWLLYICDSEIVKLGILLQSYFDQISHVIPKIAGLGSRVMVELDQNSLWKCFILNCLKIEKMRNLFSSGILR